MSDKACKTRSRSELIGETLASGFSLRDLETKKVFIAGRAQFLDIPDDILHSPNAEASIRIYVSSDAEGTPTYSIDYFSAERAPGFLRYALKDKDTHGARYLVACYRVGTECRASDIYVAVDDMNGEKEEIKGEEAFLGSSSVYLLCMNVPIMCEGVCHYMCV